MELLGLGVEMGDQAGSRDPDVPAEPDVGDPALGYQGVGHVPSDVHQLGRLLDREQERLTRFLTVGRGCDRKLELTIGNAALCAASHTLRSTSRDRFGLFKKTLRKLGTTGSGSKFSRARCKLPNSFSLREALEKHTCTLP